MPNWGRVGVGQTGISGARRHASRRYVTLRTMKSMIMTLAWSCGAAFPSLAISADSWTASAPREEIRPVFQREDTGGRSGQGALVIIADEREGLHGWWQNTFSVTAG